MIATLARDRVFLIGFAIRLALIVLLTPLVHLLQLSPFLQRAFSATEATAWTTWMLGAGAPEAFADGWPAILAFAPFTMLGGLLGNAAFGLALAVLVVDTLGYWVLGRGARTERRAEVLKLFWWSPLAILLTYWVGTLAVLPIALLLGGFLLLDRRRFAAAGLILGLAVATKPVLVVLAPIIILYAISLAKIRHGARELVVGFIGVLVAGVALFATDPGYRMMVLSAGEVSGLLALRLPLYGVPGVALLPIALAGLYYAAWRIRLIAVEQLWTLVTLALLLVLALGGAHPGVAAILIALLPVHAAYAERSGRALFWSLSALLVLWFVLFAPGAVAAPVFSGMPLAVGLAIGGDGLPQVLLLTAIAMLALVIFVQVYHRGILRALHVIASRKTIAVGIAGDSGVGKDTLADGVAALFSARTVTSVSGDDYHNWDRNKPMWRALTHLNPRANNLALFTGHVTDLIDRRWVRARHYDHKTGRMTKPLLVRPGEIVIASGLHALFSPQLNSLYDLRIFLDMDEGLRRHLKIARDVHVRGHPIEHVEASIERRRPDTETFIHPQKAEANIVLRLEPRVPENLATAKSVEEVPLQLAVTAGPGLVLDRVARELVAVCGIYAVQRDLPSGAVDMTVIGDPSAVDIGIAARRIAPNMMSLLRDLPDWQPGLRGVMQLIVLDQFEAIRRRRSVNA